jgi:hypothetical protein
MAVNPDVHVTGKLDSVIGTSGASKPTQGWVEVQLCNYAGQVPDIPSEGTVAKLTDKVRVNADGTWTIDLYSNVLIYPQETYYTFTIMDKNGDIAQIKAYRFVAAGSFDFATLRPIDPNIPPSNLPPPPLGDELVDVPYSPTPNFDDQDLYTAFRIVLTGDAAAQTFVGHIGQLYTFIIIQDGAGGHAFTWPPNCFNATAVNKFGAWTTIQTFILNDDQKLYAIAPGTYFL